MEATVDRLRERIRVHQALPEPGRRAELRKNLGLSQRQLAEAIGVSAGAIGHWETGIRHPQGQHLDRYVEALHLLEEAAA